MLDEIGRRVDLPKATEVPSNTRRVFKEWFEGDGPKPARLKGSFRSQVERLGIKNTDDLFFKARQKVWQAIETGYRNPESTTSPQERMRVVACAAAVAGQDKIVERVCDGLEFTAGDKDLFLGVAHLVRAFEKYKKVSLFTDPDVAYEFETGTFHLACLFLSTSGN